jgi:hypothetical protein
MRIIELDRNQQTHQDTEITIAGVVRATYTEPFRYVLIEDQTSTLICRPNGPLPSPKEHVQITGRFALQTPQNCTVQLAILTESNRTRIHHPTNTCDLAGCAFATQAAA